MTEEPEMTDAERASYWQGAYERMAGRNIELSSVTVAAQKLQVAPSIAPRIVSNMRVMLDEMVRQNADIGWQMALSELLSVIEHPLIKHMPDRAALMTMIAADPDLDSDVSASSAQGEAS